MDLVGKRVAVLGLGRSGRAAAQLCAARGALVTGLDRSESVAPIEGVRLELGPHRRETLLEADLVVASPGIPLTQPDLAAALAAGVQVMGELALSFALLPRVPTIGITGTNGKSTVTHLTGQLLEATGLRVFTGGNLGRPLAEAALADEPPEALVLELSSYQLELPGTLQCDAAVVLNLTPDHLSRHGSMDAYGAAKVRIFERMTAEQWAFLPLGEARLSRLAEGVGQGSHGWLGARPGVTRVGRGAEVELGGVPVVFDLSALTLPGAHNLDNLATALLLCTAVGAPAAALQAAIPSLSGLPHRMEPCGEHDGVLYINDSKATNVAATLAGISGLSRRAVVLLGGRMKDGDDLDALAQAVAPHRAVVTFGEAGPSFADALERHGLQPTRCDTMADALAAARDLALPGDAIVLSPAGSSFDAFENFERRGEIFRDLVQGVAP